jgi:hypothetical protein
MWSALFGSAEKGTLILKPDPSAITKVSGFKSGAELRVAADQAGQTVGDLLEKFNKYRGPDQQIHKVWTPTGTPVSLTQTVKGDMVVHLRAESVL